MLLQDHAPNSLYLHFLKKAANQFKKTVFFKMDELKLSNILTVLEKHITR